MCVKQIAFMHKYELLSVYKIKEIFIFVEFVCEWMHSILSNGGIIIIID